MGFCGQFKRLLKNSVITGIPQIVSTRNIAKKSLKILVFIGCMIGFFWQTFSFLSVYWTYPTVVDVEYYYPDEFDLPAVSVCSYNSIKSDIFCARFPTLCYPNNSLDEFCKDNRYFCDPNHESPGNESYPTITPRKLPNLPRSEYQEMGIQADEIVTKCIIYEAPRIQDCTNKYQNVSVFDTKFLPSNCYAYNSLWGKTTGAQQIRTQTYIVLFLQTDKTHSTQFYTASPFAIQMALHNPYSILNPFRNGFSINPCSNYYIFPSKTDKTHSTQFYTASPFAIQMALHNPYSILNPFRNGFSINPCSNYYIFPSKQINKLLPPPYTSACYNYTASWLARSGKGPLTKRLCSEECVLNKSLEQDGCVDSYYITYPNLAKICDTEPPTRESYKSCSDYCRPACEREEIDVDVQEHSHFYPRGVHKEDVCHSMIVIAFNRMELVKYSYSPKYESVSLFSYIGGYLGLWLGISLVAICDVIETAVLVIKWILLKAGRHQKMKNRIRTQQRVVYDESTGRMWFL